MSNYLIFCVFAKCSYLIIKDLTLYTHEDIFTICHKLTTDNYFGPILEIHRGTCSMVIYCIKKNAVNYNFCHEATFNVGDKIRAKGAKGQKSQSCADTSVYTNMTIIYLLCILNRAWAKLNSIFDKLTETPSPPIFIRAVKYYRLKCHIRRNCIRFSSHIKRTTRIPKAALNNVIL